MGRHGSALNGRVIISCWDGNVTDYTYVYPALDERGWPGVSGVFSDSVAAGAPNDLNAAQATELGTLRGWDICVHGKTAGDDFVADAYAAALAKMQAAKAYLDGLGVRGAEVIGPSGGIDAETKQAVIDTPLTFCIWDTVTETLTKWPLDTNWDTPYWDVDWCACADTNLWAAVKAKLDLVTGNPLQVVICSFHRIVAGGTAGHPTAFFKFIAPAYTDYTAEVTDGIPGTVAALGALPIAGSIFIGAAAPFSGVTLTVTAPNGNASILSGYYSRAGGFASFASLTDGTVVAGATLAQTGDVTWKMPGAWTAQTVNGVTAYWVQLIVSAALSNPVSVSECDCLADAPAGTQSSMARLQEVVDYVAGLNCEVTTITELDLTATLTATTALGPDGSYTAGAADVTMAAASEVAVNRLAVMGRDLVLVRNSAAVAHSVSVWSSWEPTFGRWGDVEDYELAAGDVAVFGPFGRPGWENGGYVHLVASNPAVLMGVIRLPAV